MTFLPKNNFLCSLKSETRGSKLLFPGIQPITKIGNLVCLVIGVGAIFTGLTSTVSASPIVRISGQSLQKLESQNLSKDYSSILWSIQPISSTKPLVLNQNNTVSPIIQIPKEILELIKKVEINTGGSSLDDEQVLKVQYHMNTR